MPSWTQDPRETHFLNVDLDVWSKVPLDGFVAALGRRAFVHYVGPEGKRFGAHVSIPGGGDDADLLSRRLARLVLTLPRAARRLWDQAQAREFNVGIQSGVTPHSHEVRIKPETLALVASLRGRIVVTTYAAQVEESEASTPPRRKSRPPNKALQRTSAPGKLVRARR